MEDKPTANGRSWFRPSSQPRSELPLKPPPRPRPFLRSSTLLSPPPPVAQPTRQTQAPPTPQVQTQPTPQTQDQPTPQAHPRPIFLAEPRPRSSTSPAPPLPAPEAVVVAAAAAAAAAALPRPLPTEPASPSLPPRATAAETLPRQRPTALASPSTSPTATAAAALPQQPPPKPSMSRSPPLSPSTRIKVDSRTATPPQSPKSIKSSTPIPSPPTKLRPSVAPPPSPPQSQLNLHPEPEPAQLLALGPAQSKTMLNQNGNGSKANPRDSVQAATSPPPPPRPTQPPLSKLGRKNGIAEGARPTTANEKKKPATENDELSGMRMLTIAGDNMGAHMDLGGRPHSTSSSFKHGNGYHLHDLSPSQKGSEGYKAEDGRKEKEKAAPAKANTKPVAALVNSNVQSINNSLLFNTSCTHHSPGVHITLSSSSRHPAAPLSPPPAPAQAKGIAGSQ